MHSRLVALTPIMLLVGSSAAADERQPGKPSTGETPELNSPRLGVPYLMVSLRSIDRTKEILDTLFGMIQRPDLRETLRETVFGEIAFDGVHRERPVGQLVVPAGLVAPEATAETHQIVQVQATSDKDEVQGQQPPVAIEVERSESGETVTLADSSESEPTDLWQQLDSLNPRGVVFASITDREKAFVLLESCMTPDARLEAFDDKGDLFSLIEPGENGRENREATIRFDGNHFYIAEGDVPHLLARLSGMNQAPQQIAARHDLTVALRFDELSDSARRTFHETLWREAGPRLQRRDDEPLVDFAERTAFNRTLIELLDATITGCQDITGSLNVNDSARRIDVALAINGVEGSELAQRLSQIEPRQSMFTSLIDRDRALFISLSVKLDELPQAFLLRLIEFVRSVSIPSEPPDRPSAIVVNSHMQKLLECLEETVEAGHLDLFVQATIDSEQSIRFIGGMKLVHAAVFRRSANAVIGTILSDESLNPSGEGTTLETLTRDDIVFHRFIEEDELLIADELLPLHGTFCVADGAVWAGGGTADALPLLRDAIARNRERPTSEQLRLSSLFLVLGRGSYWSRLPLPDDFDGAYRRKMARASFQALDHVQIELRPTRHGLVIEAHAEEDVLRWFASWLAKNVDESRL